MVSGVTRRIANPRELGILFLHFCLGFSVYLYLPLATYRMPYVSWGDGCSMEGFLRQILRIEYGSFRLSADDKEVRAKRTRLMPCHWRLSHQSISSLH